MIQIKISKKISITISISIITVAILSILINIFFIGRYYIYEKRKILDVISTELEIIVLNDQNIERLEEDNDVVIVYTELSDNLDNINQDIIFAFEKKKIKLNKFWITEDTLNILKEKSVNKIYDQGVSKYKVLTKFIKIGNYIFTIGMPLPYMKETIGIINRFNILIMVISIILIVSIIIVFTNKIVKPLEGLKDLSKEIAELNFKKIDIKSNDEIEELANCINKMSESLEKYNCEINTQNKRLKQLLADISHELKTPLALIKVYSQGIEDGLDDGRYIEVIKDQIDKMNMLIEKLLFWVKIDSSAINKTNFNIKNHVEELVRKYKLILDENNIALNLSFNTNEDYIVNADKEAIGIVLDNLITNSIKYTNDKMIEIFLNKENEKIRLSILNGIDKKSINNIEEIWTPFYVGEKSRNKNLSGTGLGLAIVKSILENNKLEFGVNVICKKIEFYIDFV